MKYPTTLFLIALSAAPALAQENGGSNPSDFERYGVLSERNMFLRDRSRPRTATSRPAPSTRPVETTPDTPERRYVLRGVVIEDNELRAYFENIRTGEGLRVKPGDTLGNGRIAEIAIDAVSYEGDGQLTWIDVGHNLTGVRDTSSAAAPGRTSNGAPAAAGASASGSPASAPSDPNLLSIEERMRLKRQQERGGAAR